jgi:hypothetical protein
MDFPLEQQGVELMKNRFLKKQPTGTQTSKLLLPFLVVVAVVSLFIGALSFLYVASAANNNLPPGSAGNSYG